MVLKGDADKTHLVGGTIRVLPQPKNAKFGKYVLTPREVRKLLAEKGWDAVVAFQTRNPLHRAHEYALVYGLETLLATGQERRRGASIRSSARPRATTSTPRSACRPTKR